MTLESEQLRERVAIACDKLGHRPVMDLTEMLNITNRKVELASRLSPALQKLQERPFMELPGGPERD